MAVPESLLNARLTLAERFDRSGIGGDVVGSPTILYDAGAATALDIVYEPTDRLIRTSDNREIVLSAELFVNFGVLWQNGDLVSWVDQLGRVHTRAEVIQADIEGSPTMRSRHWRLRVAGA